MSQWSGYLKQAVANVEKKLDQVLQDSSEVGTDSKRPSTRSPRVTQSPRTSVDSQRPPKNVRSSSTPRASIDVPSKERDVASPKEPQKGDDIEIDGADGFETSVEFEAFPDLSRFVERATDITSQIEAIKDDVVKDLALDLIEAAQTLITDFDTYAENVEARTTSLLSKIRYLSSVKLDELDTSSKEYQIAALLEEGQRLSHQELKLNTSLKKVRAENGKLSSQVRRAATKLSEAETKVSDLETQVKTLSTAAQVAAEKETSLKLEQAQQELVDARAKHRDVQSRLEAEKEGLLTQIKDLLKDKARARTETAELSALTEHYRSLSETTNADDVLKSRIAELQSLLDTSRSTHELARDRWDNAQEKLEQAVAHLEKDLDAARVSNAELQTKVARLHATLRDERTAAKALSANDEKLQAELEAQRTQTAQAQDQVQELQSQLASAQAARSEALQEIEDLKRREHDIATRTVDPPEPTTNTVEPGSILENFLAMEGGENLETPEPPPILPTTADTDESADDFPSRPPSPTHTASVSMFNTSRLSISSDHHGDANPHILGKLNLTISKLESELSSTRLALQSARAEKETANAELVKLLDGQDELVELRKSQAAAEEKTKALGSQVDSLLEKLGSKTELVSELQADIADLKEMYHEQIGALADEVQRLKLEQKP